MNSNDVVSPITYGKVKLLYNISKQELIENYKVESNIDITKFLEDCEFISLYECESTGYRFFYPFVIAGDGEFYEQLEQISWYYADWKWDYHIAKNYILTSARVLDIGCGEGKFLSYLKSTKGCFVEGLELNEKAQKIAIGNNISVFNLTIQEFSEFNNEKYDVVTLFQVLEHIPNVDDFLKAALKVVRPNGILVIAVPNNDPYYLKYEKDHFLNLPPHHMGWWNQRSLEAIAKIYNLEIIHIVKQPLEHYSSYTKNFLNIRLRLPKFLVKILSPLVKVFFYMNRNNINGASIMAIYKKK
ncbi:MAG: class I SAM-dependent methyltransferase [Bacteroidetes bacterium]|jgi:2-polyprenyl-3-methyl-5-hydroxy-6-metoxy-1,4-benzoquinol methylase|nr:class I SAM-dependent methyltransferase [Bacteroidota bacterium]